MELWIDISDFPNYEVSSNGRVRNKKTGRCLKFNDRKGYNSVHLSKNNSVKAKSVHRLVADSFYDGDHSGLVVNHIDGNKKNNFVGNLEWCTESYNAIHAYRTGLRVPPSGNPIKIRIKETRECFDSITDCSRHIHGSKSHVAECLKGHRKSHLGYHFEYIN